MQALADEDGLPSLVLLIRSKLLLARVLSPAAATLLVNAGTPLLNTWGPPPSLIEQPSDIKVCSPLYSIGDLWEADAWPSWCGYAVAEAGEAHLVKLMSAILQVRACLVCMD